MNAMEVMGVVNHGSLGATGSTNKHSGGGVDVNHVSSTKLKRIWSWGGAYRASEGNRGKNARDQTVI